LLKGYTEREGYSLKDNEKKLAFIKARAEGKSYSTIASELSISKSTCTEWERALKEDVEALKRANTEELYTSYNMTREARITGLGELLKGIDEAIAQKDLKELSLEKLLEYKLKYSKALKEEYVEPEEELQEDSLEGILAQYNKLYRDSQSGKLTPAQVKAQLSILGAKTVSIRELEDPLRQVI